MIKEIELKGLKNMEKLIKNIDKNIDKACLKLLEDEIKRHRKEILKSLETQHKKYLKSGHVDPVICAVYDSIMENEKKNEGN